MNKKIKFAIGFLAGVFLIAVVIIAIYLTGRYNTNKKREEYLSGRTINLTESCFELRFYGGNSEAWVEAELNDDVFKEIFKEKINPEYEYGLEWLTTARKLCEETTITLDKTDKLSNGDIITITINVPEEYLEKYDLVLGNNEFQREVSKRPETTEYDPFEGIFFYTDNDEATEQEIRMIYTNELLRGYDVEYIFDFFSSDNRHLSIRELRLNDEVTLSLNEEVEEELRLRGYFASSTSKTFVIAEDNYIKVTDVSEITDEFIAKLKADADVKILEVYDKYTNVLVKDTEFQGAWFVNTDNLKENELTLIYRINLTYGDEQKETTTYLSFTSCMIYIDDFGEFLVLGVQNETYPAYTVIDKSTMLQIQGEKLEDIMERVAKFTQID